MLRQAAIWLMLIWAIAWFGIILPGHTRGVIQLSPDPLDTQTAQNTPDCHAPEQESLGQVEAGGCCPASKPVTARGGKPRPFMGKCALCDLAAKSHGAEPFVFSLPFIGLLDLLEPPAVFTLSGVQFLVPPQSRGPPVMA